MADPKADKFIEELCRHHVSGTLKVAPEHISPQVLYHMRKPGKEIFFITGTDAFLALDSWYKGIDLLEHFSFIVSIRPGYREGELDHKIGEYRARYGTNVIKLASQMPDISATEIREKYQAGEPATGLVPETVERYITEHGLYQRD